MDIQVNIDGKFFIFAALIVLVLPVPWVIAAMIAALVHELSHILAVYLVGGTVYGLLFGVRGAVITGSSMSVPQQLICTLAGPAGSFALLFLSDIAPRLAVCGLVQGLYNLLPVYPLDGGRVLRCILESVLKDGHARTVCKWTERVVYAAVFCLAVWLADTKRLGIAPVIFSVLLVSGTGSRKISCKEENIGVQWDHHVS